MFFESHGIEVKPNAGWNTKAALIIPYERVVEHVQGRYVKQSTLF